MPVHPQAEKQLRVTRWMPPQKVLGVKLLRNLSAVRQKKMSREEVPVGDVQERIIHTENRATSVRIYTPEGPGPFPALLYIHGGGWCLGSMDDCDVLCRKITRDAGCITISIEYGLAPEHKFPAPVEECYAIVKWVFDNAQDMGIISKGIAVGGDSAGGNIAAALCLLCRDRGALTPAYQVLICPCVQLRIKTESRHSLAKGYGLTAKDMAWYEKLYIRSESDARDPLASPLLADSLAGLPPALIITAEYDPLRDEGQLYGDRLSRAGVEAQVKQYDGMLHDFVIGGVPPDTVDQAIAEIVQKLGAAFLKKM